MIPNILILAAAFASGSQGTGIARHAEPEGNPGRWVSASDYPREALAERAEGTTRFTLTIKLDGSIKSCAVTSSSGFPILDEQTCRSLESNASFRPALDENGNPIESEWSSAVRWNIPEQFTFPFRAEQTIRITLVQEKNGVISSCKVEGLDDESGENIICEGAKSQLAWPEGHTYEPDRKKIVLTTTQIREISVLED